jgi:hypothetical protein
VSKAIVAGGGLGVNAGSLKQLTSRYDVARNLQLPQRTSNGRFLALAVGHGGGPRCGDESDEPAQDWREVKRA